MRQLAFFGAFNPPTLAHLNLAELALEQTGAESVIFVPSRADYIREDQGKDRAFSDGERLSLLETLARTRPWMQVCSWEMEQASQPRTYETLCHLRREGYEPALLLGSDKLPELEHGWKHVREIAEEFGIVCLSRGEDNVESLLGQTPFLTSLKPYIRPVEAPGETRQISSTRVRRILKEIRELEEEMKTLVPGELLPLLLGREDTRAT